MRAFGVEEELLLVDDADLRPAPAWTVIDELADWTADSIRRHGDTDLVGDGLNRIRAGGGGAARQRAAFAGTEQLSAVVADAARRTVAG